MVEHEVGYSFASYPALAAWHWGISTPHLEEWIGRRQEPTPFTCHCDVPTDDHVEIQLPVEAICSVLADQSWSLTGKRIMVGVPHQCVTPSTLAQTLLTKRPEIVEAWGFPGIL